jgi:hypothetical protein
LAERGDDTKQPQRHSDAVHEGQHWKLKGEQQSSKHECPPQANGRRDNQDKWAKREAQHQDRRGGEKHLGQRQADAQQEDRREQTAKAPCKRMQGGVNNQMVEVAIEEERH